MGRRYPDDNVHQKVCWIYQISVVKRLAFDRYLIYARQTIVCAQQHDNSL
jgi:hypothetical protein